MTHILHIDSSPRGERSFSRRFSNEFVKLWQKINPDTQVTYRDLGHNPVPHVTEEWIASVFTPPEARTPELAKAIELSDSLVDEFLTADRYVIGVPMYNLNVPSTFKAYIDQIIRAGRTFSVTEQGSFEGLVKGKKMLIVTARGGSFAPDSPTALSDYQEPYLRAVFEFIGINNISFIHLENLAAGDAFKENAVVKASEKITQLVDNW
ncbi:FMN-dependent NADH-azoreductase [Nostoc sp.]|uniref:FMN-dependent NADH-azoreductase n=1 Tax=Nostoc sp. TaxID=1180 RepID=UPI002FF8AF90